MMRRVHSIQSQLLVKSKEAALNAVQTFNNPLTTFRTETFITLMVIAWTYLLHAHYRKKGVEYRYHEVVNGRRRFDRTKNGSFKYWSLEDCLRDAACPLDKPTIANLFFLIGLRHEVEHQMCLDLERHYSARYLACCLNYQAALTTLFGKEHSVESLLPIAIQFSQQVLTPEEQVTLAPLPTSVSKYVQEFDANLDPEDFKSPHFAQTLIFTKKLVNHPSQATQAIEFVAPDSDIGKAIDKQYWVVKPEEKKKFPAKEVVALMQREGYPRFNTHHHTKLWQAKDGKNPNHAYGVELYGRWFWYEKWLPVVRKECKTHPELYGPLPRGEATP